MNMASHEANENGQVVNAASCPGCPAASAAELDMLSQVEEKTLENVRKQHLEAIALPRGSTRIAAKLNPAGT